MSQQQPFAKNTNIPDQDSGLWAVGNDWKISAKTGKTYCSLDGLTDPTLGAEMEKQLNSEFKTPYQYQGYWYVPSSMENNGKLTLLVYAFDNEDGAEKHASYKPMSGGGGQQQQQQSYSQKPKIQFKPKYQAPSQTTATNVTYTPTNIPTYTDEQPVEWSDFVKKEELTKDGFVRIPASLISPNVFENKEGNQCIWMGKIINAKIT